MKYIFFLATHYRCEQNEWQYKSKFCHYFISFLSFLAVVVGVWDSYAENADGLYVHFEDLYHQLQGDQILRDRPL